jgi:hypothetical protein
MSEMVERVAKAIWALNEDTDCHDYDQLAPHARARADEWARAAIAVMREPTKAMIEAHHVVWEDADFNERAADNWRNLIDEALK